ncbi:TPA: hypothetical protein U2L27_001577 [Acinetobacter baumannii]|nr:hypothetical protein [Acinetobacter baumannii]HEM7769468.1 hypothetical protein [Acinetobacter baumannii]
MKVKLTQKGSDLTLILDTFIHKDFAPSHDQTLSVYGISAVKDENGNFVLNEDDEIVAFNTAPRTGSAKLNGNLYQYEVIGYLND